MAVQHVAGSRRGPGRPPLGSEDKRERILTEALRLFSSSGYRGTSLSEIAQAADISKAGLLHHFPSKESLFIEVLRRRGATEPPAGDGRPEEALDRWLRIIETNTHNPELVALFASMSMGALSSDHPAHPWLKEHFERTILDLARMFERARPPAACDPMPPRCSSPA